MPDTLISPLVADRVRAVLARVLDVLPEQLTDDATIYDDLNADSLDGVEIMMGLEEAFGIELDTPGMIGARTVGQLVALVEART